jgi:dTMP kinase
MIANPHPGTFCGVDGIDGGGKSTIIRLLAHMLRERGFEVIQTKEPDKQGMYGRLIYEDLKDPNGLHRRDPFLFQGWYASDSKINLRDKVISRIQSNVNQNVVLTDRFRSSMVYGAKIEADIPELMAINRAIIGEHFIWPDALFLLDLEPQKALARLNQKGVPLDQFETREKLEHARPLFLAFARMYPGNCHIISADQKPEDILADIWKVLERVFQRKAQVNRIIAEIKAKERARD